MTEAAVVNDAFPGNAVSEFEAAEYEEVAFSPDGSVLMAGWKQVGY